MMLSLVSEAHVI